MARGTDFQISKFPKKNQPIWLSTMCEIWKQAKDTDLFPDFPDDPSPDGSGLFGKLGNWDMARGTDFQISQFPTRPQPRWLSTIWEIGKWLQVHTSKLSNFPEDPSPDGPARFGKLGNWEMAGGTDFQISKFPKRPQLIWLSTIWEIGKWLQVHTSKFPNFPKDPSPDGLARFGKLGNGWR